MGSMHYLTTPIRYDGLSQAELNLRVLGVTNLHKFEYSSTLSKGTYFHNNSICVAVLNPDFTLQCFDLYYFQLPYLFNAFCTALVDFFVCTDYSISVGYILSF